MRRRGIINALTVQIPRHNTVLFLLTLDTLCYPVGTHKHDRHHELHYANETTLNKETTHSRAVINLKKIIKALTQHLKNETSANA